MNTVELVKSICKERGISIAKLERDCDFSNGYIRRLKEGKLPSDRLVKIANYLNLSIEYLSTGEEKEIVAPAEQVGWYLDPETAKAAQEAFENPETRALFDAARNARPEDIRLAVEMLKRFKETNPDG